MPIVPEWQRHHATLLAWPQRPELWEGQYQEIQEVWARVISLLSRTETVYILINPTSSDSAIHSLSNAVPNAPFKQDFLKQDILARLERKQAEIQNIKFCSIATDDVWIRDYGPIWIGAKEAVLFEFDGWAKKYSPYDQDQASGAKLLAKWEHAAVNKDFVMEGGAMDTDGQSLLLTESCTLFRSPYLKKSRYEQEFRACFGIEDIIWLKAGLPGDDTDGHVDMISRFVGQNTVLSCVCPKDQAAHHILQENQRRLKDFRGRQGQQLEVIDLPLPPQTYSGGLTVPHTYANFYIANQQILVPVYGESSDETALGIIQECFPQHRIEAIDVNLMYLEGGGVHCMTMQVPDFSSKHE